jgi:hypothetical protein
VQRVITAIHSHCVLDAHEISQVFFEITQLLSQNQITLGERVRNSEIDFALQPPVVLTGIYERHLVRQTLVLHPWEQRENCI